MRKIRQDVIGVVMVHDGTSTLWLAAGEVVPSGVSIDDLLVDAGDLAAPEETEDKPKRGRPRKKVVDAGDD